MKIDLLFLCVAAALLLALAGCTGLILALSVLLPRGSAMGDRLRGIAGRLPELAVLSLKLLYTIFLFGVPALFVILTLVYA